MTVEQGIAGAMLVIGVALGICLNILLDGLRHGERDRERRALQQRVGRLEARLTELVAVRRRRVTHLRVVGGGH